MFHNLTFSPNKLMAFSISAKFIPSTFRITGTTKPWKKKSRESDFRNEPSSTHNELDHKIHSSYLWCSHSHTDINIVPVHNLFGCVINYWKHKTRKTYWKSTCRFKLWISTTTCNQKFPFSCTIFTYMQVKTHGKKNPQTIIDRAEI